MRGAPDANWKMNPPLRGRADMLAMRRALADGTIDRIATDHAPHTPAEKAAGWDDAPFGCIGLETAPAACLSLVQGGELTFARWCRGAELGARFVGAVASYRAITLFDRRARWVVEPEQFYSKGRNCPFAGMTFTGKALLYDCERPAGHGRGHGAFLTAEESGRAMMNAKLVLSDGTVFSGTSIGAPVTNIGEVVFNTGMTGYQEMVTDPSYRGQILTFTYPLIGNYGITAEDWESGAVQVRGVVVKQLCDRHSNWRACRHAGRLSAANTACRASPASIRASSPASSARMA